MGHITLDSLFQGLQKYPFHFTSISQQFYKAIFSWAHHMTKLDKKIDERNGGAKHYGRGL